MGHDAPAFLTAAIVFVALPCLAQESLPMDVLHGTVNGPDGAPAAGVPIEVRRRPAEGFNCLDLAYAHEGRVVQRLRTSKTGAFATHLPRGVPFQLWVDDGVHAPIVLRAVHAGESLKLQLTKPAALSIVLRQESGAPAPGGPLEGWNGQHVRFLEGVVDAEGRYRRDRLPVGMLTVDIAPALARRPDWQRLLLEPGVTTEVELTVAPGVRLSGKVTDARTGAPIAGARIGEGWTMDKYIVSAPDGSYDMQGFGAAGYLEYFVRAAGYGTEAVRLQQTPSAAIEHDFALERGREATGRIVRADGTPAGGVYVAAIGPASAHTWISARTDAKGEYRLDGLLPGIAHVLYVRAEGAASLVGNLPELPREGGLQLPAVALRTARYLTGTVRDQDGNIAAGVEVELQGCNADRATLLGGKATGHAGADHNIAQRTVRTDSLGRFHFADLPAGSYQLLLGRAGEIVEVDAQRDPEPLQLTCSR